MSSRAVFSILVFISIILSGCSAPMLKVGIDAKNNLNPDVSGDSYAVLVRFYQLTDPALFEEASVGALLRQDDELLSATLVGKKELMVSPGMTMELDIPKVKTSKYLGVAAFYRDLSSGQQVAFKKVNTGKMFSSTKLELTLEKNQIHLNYR